MKYARHLERIRRRRVQRVAWRKVREWDEADHPRDEDGKFSGGGGSDSSGDSSSGDKPAASEKPDYGFMVSGSASKEVKEQIAATLNHLPAEHMRVVSDSGIKVSPSTGSLAGEGVLGLYIRTSQTISLPATATINDGGVMKTQDFTQRWASTLTHEVGHAIDNILGAVDSGDESSFLMDGPKGDAVKSAFDSDWEKLPSFTQFAAGHYTDAKEAFAEAYKTLYSPRGPGHRYFGMTRVAAENSFPATIAAVKNIIENVKWDSIE